MSSLTSSSSSWKSAVSKAKKLQSKVDKIFHKYPKLPKTLPREDSLPLQIGSEVSVENYNTFLDQNEKTGYKFHWDNGNVYIIEMANPDHEAVTQLLIKYFDIPNNGAIRGPIKVSGQSYHFNPINHGEKMAPDAAIYPSSAHVARPTVQHPGPPPSDTNGYPHARIMVEVANAQDINSWNARCETWMHQEYVRYVFGIKLDFVRSHQGHIHRSMLARLWTRETPAPAGFTAVANLPGVSVKNWDFGTLDYGTTTPSGCTGPGIAGYQVTIPVADVFWNPQIRQNPTTNVNAPNPAGYTITVPGTITAPNFVIDLYQVQQETIDTQRV